MNKEVLKMFDTMAERLRWLRKFRCHKTQLEIGKKVGVGKATIQKYECGVITNIPPDKIELLAEALETTPGFIMGWEKDPDSERLDFRFGNVLRKERERLGMSAEEFARKIGLSESELLKYESGDAIPSANVAYPIAIQLGISPEEYDPLYNSGQQAEAEEETFIDLYRQLSPHQKERTRSYMQGMIDSAEDTQ